MTRKDTAMINIRKDLDHFIFISEDYNDLLKNLNQNGYTIRDTKTNLSLYKSESDYNNPIRVNRLGEDYYKENILRRLEEKHHEERQMINLL